MAYEPTNDELQDAVALLSSILHRLEVRGVELTTREANVWLMATDILQGMKISRETVEQFADLSKDLT